MQPSKTAQDAYKDHELHEKVERALRELADLRQDARRKIPSYIDEFNTQTTGTVLDVPARCQNMYRAASLTIYVGGAGGATVTIGPRSFVVPSGLTYLPDLEWLIRQSDKRNITAQASGLLFMEITGEETADQYGW